VTDETTRPTTREPDHAIEPIFAERWSPRVFTGEAVPEAELLRMFEAARWSPSSFFDLLVPGNQKWAEGTGALVFLVSSERMKVGDELKPSASHSLDAGAASLAFALQANRQGWHVHGMGGFDRERAPAALNVPEHHRVEAAYGVGRATPWAELSEEQRAKERPNGRRPITDFAFRGGFPQRQD
jgi:nitroreductase